MPVETPLARDAYLRITAIDTPAGGRQLELHLVQPDFIQIISVTPVMAASNRSRHLVEGNFRWIAGSAAQFHHIELRDESGSDTKPAHPAQPSSSEEMQGGGF